MPSQITAEDLAILDGYVDRKDRKRYWSFLAEKGDSYAQLALGVVLNNTPPGIVANNFFWTRYRPNRTGLIDEAELNKFGIDLMTRDLSERRSVFAIKGGEEALHLSALSIYNEHKDALPSIDHWTPAGLLKQFFEGPNPNTVVGQEVWNAFIALGKQWSANPTITGALNAAKDFTAALFRLDGRDDRVWSTTLVNWVNGIFLPGALTSFNLAQSFAGSPEQIQGWSRDAQSGQWFRVEQQVAPMAIGVRMVAPAEVATMLDANRQFRLDQQMRSGARDPRDRWSRDGLKVAFDEVRTEQIDAIASSLGTHVANDEFAALLRELPLANLNNGTATDSAGAPAVWTPDALQQALRRELRGFVDSGKVTATITEQGEVLLSSGDREVLITRHGVAHRILRLAEGKEVAEAVDAAGLLLSRDILSFVPGGTAEAPVLVPVVLGEIFQDGVLVGRTESTMRPGQDHTSKVDIQFEQTRFAARYVNGVLVEILNAQLDGITLSPAALDLLRQRLPALSTDDLARTLPRAAHAATHPADTADPTGPADVSDLSDLTNADLATTPLTQLTVALRQLGDDLVASTDYYGKRLWVSAAEAKYNTLNNGVAALINVMSLVKAIQSGRPLPVLATGLRVVGDFDMLDGSRDLPQLGAAGSMAGTILSIQALANSLESGDVAGAFSASAYAVKGAADVANFLQTSGAINEVPAALQAAGQTIGNALPYINLVNSIAHGDDTGTAIAVTDLVMIHILEAYTVPVVGWAYAVYSIVKSLLDDAPEPAKPWGTGQFVWRNGVPAIEAIGESGGQQGVEQVMHSALAALEGLLERVRQQNPGSALGLIPNRMPTVAYDLSGYRYTEIDPHSGAEQHPGLRYELSLRPYNALPGSVAAGRSLVEAIIYSALAREAIAPLWEVRTAQMQSAAGDPRAGLTEEERAGRDGLLAHGDALASAGGSAAADQTFRPVVLDLDGDGIVQRDHAHGVLFDVDDSGYLKQSAWIGGDDGFLVLDRNLNGRIDSAREMFANAAVALDLRGLRALAWLDANADGQLSSADPVWGELRVWRDRNGNGAQNDGEQQTLAALGITALNFSMGTFTRDGVLRQLASPDLPADRDGTQLTLVPEGMLLKSSAAGTLSLLVTRVDDRTAVEANRDAVSGYEDIELVIAPDALLANDELGGFVAHDLQVTGLGAMRHGSGFIDANGFVHFRPNTHYDGADAGFDYTVRARNGQSAVASVDITMRGENDAPGMARTDFSTRLVYGFTPTITSAIDESGVEYYSSGGNPIYTPYAYRMLTDESWQLVFNPQPDPDFFQEHTVPLATEFTGSARLVGYDPDDPSASLRFELVSPPQYGAVEVRPDGSFIYTDWKANGVPSDHLGLEGQNRTADWIALHNNIAYGSWNLPAAAINPATDVFTVRITDPHGTSSIAPITVPHHGPYLPQSAMSSGGGGKKPIAVDLDGDGFEFTDVDDANVFFDINGDGWKRRTAWVGRDDGLLAWDSDGNGRIERAAEISFVRYQAGAQTDLEGLRAFDSNGNGQIDAGDQRWARLGVWHDANQNGITDDGEWRTFDALGVTAVTLASGGRFQVINGQTVHGLARMTRQDHTPLAIADVTLAYRDTVRLIQADGSTVEVPVTPYSAGAGELVGSAANDLLLGKGGHDVINAGAGDDVIVADGGNDLVDGGAGNDRIHTGADNDLIQGGAGDDAVFAGPGEDILLGGDGHDALLGESGNDVMFGGAGQDLLAGGTGNDVLSGDDGDDDLLGGDGHDALFGGAGQDRLVGEDNDDQLAGGPGDDQLFGGAGADVLTGGAGSDRLDGSDDNDTLQGDAGDDTLLGGAGNDVLQGNAGNDILDGGSGDDTFLAARGDGLDRLKDLAGLDTVRFANGLTLAEISLRIARVEGNWWARVRTLDGHGNPQADQGLDIPLTVDASYRITSSVERFEFADGRVATIDELLIRTRTTPASQRTAELTTGREDDIILAGTSRSVVHAGSGNDIIYAGAQGDTLHGEGGNDLLQGNQGADTLDGAWGDDVLAGAAGADEVRDPAGRNVLLGGAGNDRITGGADNDFIAGGRNDDAINPGGGDNIIAFNRGDGRDRIAATADARNTLSLGGGIDAAALTLRRADDDLVLGAGGDDQITLADWYGPGNAQRTRMQIVTALPASADNANGMRIANFDFDAVARAYERARAGMSTESPWQVREALLDAHLASSSSAALGGEVAMRFATGGGDSALALGMARDTLQDPAFGAEPQTVGSRFNATVMAYRLT